MLNEFYLARIGLRFLIEHHITSHVPKDGFSGIIESNCKPREYLETAGAEALSLCEYHYGFAPTLRISEVNQNDKDAPVGFTYVPGHLQYMLVEVLKNAARATAEKHGNYAKRPLNMMF